MFNKYFYKYLITSSAIVLFVKVFTVTIILKCSQMYKFRLHRMLKMGSRSAAKIPILHRALTYLLALNSDMFHFMSIYSRPAATFFVSIFAPTADCLWGTIRKTRPHFYISQYSLFTCVFSYNVNICQKTRKKYVLCTFHFMMYCKRYTDVCGEICNMRVIYILFLNRVCEKSKKMFRPESRLKFFSGNGLNFTCLSNTFRYAAECLGAASLFMSHYILAIYRYAPPFLTSFALPATYSSSPSSYALRYIFLSPLPPRFVHLNISFSK